MEDGGTALKNAIRQGDYIYFYVDRSGFFAIPSQHEPLPEHHDTVSHLRAISSESRDKPEDFNQRIVGDKGQIRSQAITYGSTVRLVHCTTGLTVVASNNEDCYDPNARYNTVYLRNNLTPFEETAAQWEVMTRYRLRNEGDHVVSSDFVVLRSILFKRKYLTAVPPTLDQAFDYKDSLIGLTGDAFTKLGWQIHLIQSHSDHSPTSPYADYLLGAAYVRLNHQEVGGHLMVRCDDASILATSVGPLGRVCDKLSVDTQHGHGVFMRIGSVDSDPANASSMWQIIPEVLDHPHPLKSGSGVRLRHVLTGNYLCIRPVYDRDTEVIKKSANKIKKESSGAKGVQTVMEEWAVATTPSPDKTTLFLVYSADVFEESIVLGSGSVSSFISARENVFFLHDLTRMTMQLKSKPDSDKMKSETKPRRLQWEYYADDVPMRPAPVSADLAILSEAYRVDVVNEDDVKDLVYVTRYLALAKAALAAIQFTQRMDELYLPLFQHLNVALYTLLGWVGGEFESDGCLAPHPKILRSAEATNVCGDEVSDEESMIADDILEDEPTYDSDNSETELSRDSDNEDQDILQEIKAAKHASGIRSVYSMRPWIGRGGMDYSRAALASGIDSHRNEDGMGGSYKVNRQNLISDSRLLDFLVKITQVVYLLVSQQTMKLTLPSSTPHSASSKKWTSAAEAEGQSRAEMEATYKVPPLVTSCCMLIHDLVHSCVFNNRRNAVRILSVKGTLLNLMDQEILGWRPAIRTLLVALKSSQLGTVVRKLDTFDTSNILSEQDIHNLIMKTYILYMKNDEAAVHILDLVTTLCSPGELPNRIFQDLITNVLFTEVNTSPYGDADSDAHMRESDPASHCLLFSTRIFNRSTWEIKLKVHYDISSVDSPPQSVRKAIKAELDGLKALYAATVNNRDSGLRRPEAERILCQLGFGGNCLFEEAAKLEGCSQHMFIDWWWENRRVYLPSSMKELNHMSRHQATAQIVSASNGEFDLESDEESSDHNSDSESNEDSEQVMLSTANVSQPSNRTLFGRLFGFRNAAKPLDERPPAMQLPDDEFALSKQKSSKAFPDKKVKAISVSALRKAADHSKRLKEVPFEAKRDSLGIDMSLDGNVSVEKYNRLQNAYLIRVPRYYIGPFDDYIRAQTPTVSAVQVDREEDTDTKYSGLSLLLNTSMNEAKKRIMRTKHSQVDEEWTSFRLSLSRGSFERDWIRRAIYLLSELCRGKNNFAQNKIRNIFPAPLVLEMLDYGESIDKMMACSLLLNLFVEHDFVFSVKALTSEQGRALSLHEYDNIARVDAGLLFNDMTRVVNLVDLETAYSMRRNLWDFTRKRLEQLDLSKSDSDVARYNVSFLILLRKLLGIGFFEESPAFIEESENMAALARSNGLVSHDTGLFGCFGKRRVEAFDEYTIGKALVSKVDSSMTAHSDGLEAVKKGVLDILKNDRDVGRLTEDEFEAVNYRIHSSSGESIGSENIELVERYFGSVFGDSNQISAYREVLSILSLTHDMQQMSRAKRIMSWLCDADHFFRPDVLAGDTEVDSLSPRLRIKYSKADKKHIMKLLEIRADDDKLFNRSLLSVSLHHNNAIRHSAYYLMYRRQSVSIDLKNIMDSVRYVVNADEALLLRLLTHLRNITDRYADDLFDTGLMHSLVFDDHRRKMITFAVDAMTAMCYHSFKPPVNEVYFPQNPLDISRGPKDAEDAGEDGMQMEKAETDNSYIQNLLANARRVSLLGLTSDIASNLPRSSRRECHNLMGEFMTHFLHYVKKVCVSKTVSTVLKTWSELTDHERFYVDTVLSFCASACCGAASLTQTHLLATSRYAMQYMWQSPGATRIVDILFMHCHLASEVMDDKMLKTLEDNVTQGTVMDEPMPDAISILVSIVSSGQQDRVYQEVMKIIKKSILTNGAMVHMIKLDMINPSNIEIRFHVHLLRLFSVLALMGVEEDVELLKTNVPKEFCRRVLSNSSPLQVKTCVMNISRKLYSMDEVPVIEYVQQDLKALVDLLNQPTSTPQLYNSIETTIIDYLDVCARYMLSLARKCHAYNEMDTVNTKKFIYDNNKERGLLDLAVRKLISSNPSLLSTEPISQVGVVEPVIFFDCILHFYGVLRSPSMQRVVDVLVRNKRVLDMIMNMFAAALVTFQRIHVNAKEISPANMLLREHLQNAANGLAKLCYKSNAKFNSETFLLTDGIELYLRKIKKTLMPTEIDPKVVLLDHATFVKTIDYLPSIPAKMMKKTALFGIMMEYLDSAANFREGGGGQLLHHAHHVISETPLLKKSTDFEKWLLGGGRHIMNLAQYIAENGEADRMTSNMLHLFSLLLDNNIDSIRERQIPLKIKISLVQDEVRRLQRLQDAFDSLGGCKLVLSLVGRTLSYTSLNEPFVALIAPLGLKLGFALLASGNESVQLSFISTYKKACSSDNTATKSKFFISALRAMVRKIVVKTESYMKRPTGPFPVDLLKKLMKVYNFCASLCSGHNNDARNFLRDQHKVGEVTDIVSDIAKSVDTVLSLLCDQMKYISYDKFYDLLGPCVWKHKPDVKRRFVAWQEKVDFQFVCHLMVTLIAGFNSLTEITQGPCLKNQPSALLCTGRCPDLLEYVGALQLRASTVSKGRVGVKRMEWNGSNPIEFFKNYERELSRLGWFHEDPQSYSIQIAMQKWSNIGKRVDGQESRSTSIDILGVDINMLFHFTRETEHACLRFLLALLEASSEIVTERLVSQLDDGILLQNMENQYKLSFDRHDQFKKYRSSATVQYLTLISTLAAAQREDPTVILDDLLIEWKEDSAKQGYNTERLVASIEICSGDGSVQSVYFPIPPFVTKFWPYPEVQKSKHAILFEVNRESAEDKLGNFYELMHGLVHVMRRQERLRILLTPPLHALFGGNNFFVRVFPPLQYCKMRPTFFFITLLFSIYYAYDAYRDEYPWIKKNEVDGFKMFWSWDQKELVLDILAYSHMSLGAALCIREWINSPAVDSLEPFRLPLADNVRLLQALSVIFSVMGFFISPYWYAPALLDIIPQIRLMSFLIEAITRNTSRIFYTLLLAIVLLYLYSVITIVFFKNQYGLAGHFACNDLISCFKLQIDYGLVNPPEWIGEGYIDPFISNDFNEHETYGYVSSILMGTTFNFTYIILINLVLQAIISGLIIDTFGEMRAESEAVEDDIREKCFMCSIDRDQFEHSGIPFQEHVTSEHNMWHYVWFYIYIESKDPLTYTGPEQYVFENMTDKTGFVRLGPIKKSLSISRKSGKVKEEFTLKGVYESLSKISKSQQLLMSTSQTLSAEQAKTTELCASQDKTIVELTSMIKDTVSAIDAIVPSVTGMKDEIMSIVTDISPVTKSTISRQSAMEEDVDET